MDKLYNTILHTVDSYKRSFSVYVITNKTSKIYFFVINHCLTSMEYLYQCFIALNELIPPAKLMDINNSNNISDYFNYRNKYSIITHKNKYIELGVQSKV